MKEEYKTNKVWATALSVMVLIVFSTIAFVIHSNNARDIACVENGKSVVHATLEGAANQIKDCK